MKTALRPIGPLLCSCLTIAACQHTGAPQEGTFTIDFPSTAAAIASSSLEVYVFASDDATSTTLCHELVSARSTKNTWPIAPLSMSTFAPCQLVTNPGSVTLPAADFGERAIVVVGLSSSNSDLLIGCQRVTLGAGDLPIPIPLTLMTPTELKPTTCTTMREHCDGKC